MIFMFTPFINPTYRTSKAIIIEIQIKIIMEQKQKHSNPHQSIDRSYEVSESKKHVYEIKNHSSSESKSSNGSPLLLIMR